MLGSFDSLLPLPVSAEHGHGYGYGEDCSLDSMRCTHSLHYITSTYLMCWYTVTLSLLSLTLMIPPISEMECGMRDAGCKRTRIVQHEKKDLNRKEKHSVCAIRIQVMFSQVLNTDDDDDYDDSIILHR